MFFIHSHNTFSFYASLILSPSISKCSLTLSLALSCSPSPSFFDTLSSPIRIPLCKLSLSHLLSLFYSSLTPIESFVSRIYFAATGPILILCLRSLRTQKTQKSRNSNQKFDANFETLDILKFKSKKYFFGRSAKAKKNFHKNRFKIGISKSTANKSQRE